MLLIDKPVGPTAHDVVAGVRRTLNVRRVGHSGTLDPFASGLLVILVGRATRLSRFVADLSKEYSGSIRLGETTDSGDLTGAVVANSDAWRLLSDADVEAAMTELTGELQQTPPSFSAKKVAGQRAYRLARRGDQVELPPCDIEVYRFQLLNRSGPLVEFGCSVSSGTYVRALARDLGVALGCGAHLQALRRQSVGPFDVAQACALSELDAATAVRPALEAVAHLPTVVVRQESHSKVCHGQPIPSELTAEGPVALVADDDLLAVAELQGGMLRPRVVLWG